MQSRRQNVVYRKKALMKARAIGPYITLARRRIACVLVDNKGVTSL